MAALEIQCFLEETQMSALTNHISERLYCSQNSELEDIDICFETMSIRLCVEFDTIFGRTELKQAEILDEDWNVIDADSAVLRSRLKSIIKTYNYTEEQLTSTCQTFRNEQKSKLLSH